jgi:uncharacterized protein (DUF433 family)
MIADDVPEKRVVLKGLHMIPDTPTLAVPLRRDESGALRIGKTRVLLELVIQAYHLGETPEGIVDMYPSLSASEVYAVIGYFLANTAEVDAYVLARELEGDANQRMLEARMTPDDIAFRARLREMKARQRSSE